MTAKQHYCRYKTLNNKINIDLSEKELVKSCLTGNARSQKHFFEVYSGNMMTVARSFAVDNQEAKDIIQESFTKIFQNLDKFRFESSLKGWIRSIVVNTAIKYSSAVSSRSTS